MPVAARFLSAGASDPGRRRGNNEDRYLCDPAHGIYAVVDGMGGEAAGEEAAAIAVKMLAARLERKTGTTADRIREAIAVANNEIYDAAQRQPGMAGYGLRADCGGGGRRARGHRARGRFAALPAARRARSAR